MTSPTDPSVQMVEPKVLAVAGDWHGNTQWALSAIEYASNHGADAIIQVGDFGFWTAGKHTEHYLARVEEMLQDCGVLLYWLDGNHEDHTRRAEFNDPAERPLTTYLPRGTRWEWWGKKWMAVGGAFSIDRYLRKEGVGWWPEELLTDEEVELACSPPHGLDVILTHDCPRGVNIPGIGPDSKPRGGQDIWPADMLYGAQLHREKMRQIWDAHQPGLWIHGHYHVLHETWLRNTKFIGLDCDGRFGGGPMSDNVMILKPGDIK